MPTHVALLRGINVGGHARVAMPALRECVAALGHTEVATYLQSGNVVFTPAGAATPIELAAQLGTAIAERLGVGPAVVVLTRDELAAVVADNPFPGEPDGRRLHAVIGAEDYTPEQHLRLVAALEASRAAGSDDDARIAGRVLWLHTPGGFGTSRLAAGLSRVQGSATARNWRTVTALLSMLDG